MESYLIQTVGLCLLRRRSWRTTGAAGSSCLQGCTWATWNSAPPWTRSELWCPRSSPTCSVTARSETTPMCPGGHNFTRRCHYSDTLTKQRRYISPSLERRMRAQGGSPECCPEVVVWVGARCPKLIPRSLKYKTVFQYVSICGNYRRLKKISLQRRKSRKSRSSSSRFILSSLR